MIVKIMMLIICWNMFYPIMARIFGVKIKNVLSCGLIGFSSDHKADAGILRLLLMYNLERGEDSTGWAINNEVTKDIVDVKKFLSKNKLELLDTHENFTFIAHARKSSSGGKFNKELAHPFGIYKDGAEKAKYDLVLAMNGTLSNTTEMAKKFEVEYVMASNSDTQILARIMAKLGEKEFIKALESYDGTATLLFFTPKYSNSLMVYKDPERPLFYWQKGKNEMYISSMDDSLFAAGAEIEDVHHFEDNTVYRITKGRITKETKVVRTPIKKEVKAYTNKDYDDYGYSTDRGGGQQGKFFGGGNNSNMDLFKLDLLNTKPKNGDGVYCLVDRYFRNGHPLNGSLLLDIEGKEQKTGDDVTKFKRYYFVNGNMFKDEESYNSLKALCSGTNNDVDLPKFKEMRMSRLCEYLAYPPIGIIDEMQKFVLNKDWKDKVNAIGDNITYSMPFTDILMTLVWQGKCIEVKDEGKPEQIVRICDVKDIKKKEGEYPNIDKTANFDIDVKNMLLTYENMSTDGLCERILVKWKSNNTPDMKAMFFKKFLNLTLSEGITSQEAHEDLNKMGKECAYNSEDKRFSEEIGRCISLLRCKYKGTNIGKITSIVNIHVAKEDLDGNDIEELTQTATIIKSLQDNNTFYQANNFKTELYNGEYEDLTAFSKDWSSSTSKLDPDMRVFAEGILLGLHTIGKISTDEELLSLIELSDVDIQQQAEERYIDYCKDINRKDDEDVEEKSISQWTKQDHEDDTIDRCNDIRESIEAEIKEMELVPEDLRSEKFKAILDFYIGIFAQMTSDKSKT